jgi:hypothetical protein
MRFYAVLMVAFIFGVALKGADITLTLEGGSLVIRNPRFFERSKALSSNRELVLSFVLENHTPNALDGIDLEFKIGGFCNGELEPLQWSYVVHDGYLAAETTFGKPHEEAVTSVSGSVTNCKGEIIKARIVLALMCAKFVCATNQIRRIQGNLSEPFDLEPGLRLLQPARAKDLAEERQKQQARAKDVAEERQRLRIAALEADKKLERNAIAPPSDWETWNITKSCSQALGIFELRRNSSAVTASYLS